MKRLWWIPYSMLVVIGVILSLAEWAVESLGLLIYRASMWIEDEMKENQDAR